MTFWKSKALETVKRSMFSRIVVNKQSTEGIWDSETILYDVVMVDKCPSIFAKTYRRYNTKREP